MSDKVSTVDARAILDRACDRYGGWEQWRRIQRIDLAIKHLGGPLLTMKGYKRTFRSPHRVSVWPHRCRTVFHNYPYIESAGVFDSGRVCIAREPVADNFAPNGTSHRATFRGFEKYRRWSHLDAIFFFGYALWHYHSMPFALAETRVVRAVSSRGGSALTVEFPAGVETHSTRETFYFDETGLIVRHDYVVDIAGTWARGAHEWRDYRVVNGFPVATQRKVWVRIGGVKLPLPVLSATIGAATITFAL